MSESDSFITEVTEEVRRDKLFKSFKKYWWILAVIIGSIVGGTIYNEWNKARITTESRLTGDVMRAAFDASDANTFAEMAAENTPAAVLANFQLSALLAAENDIVGAVAALSAITETGGLSEVYTDLARLKMIMLVGNNMPAESRDAIMAEIIQETDPYRLLALEQRALQSIRDDNIDAALDDLSQILADETLTQGLRNRAQELTISVGGTLAETNNT